MGQAALRAHEEHVFAAWCVVLAGDRAMGGSGLCSRASAIAWLKEVFTIGSRQAERLLREGGPKYWRLLDGDRVLLTGQAMVARALGVQRVSRHHEVPISDLAGRGKRRAALVALAYRTDENGTPLTRRLIRELTGLPATTQRRLERNARSPVLVRPVFAHFGRQPSQWYADQAGGEFRDWGFFSTPGARLHRQHGSIRQAGSHRIGSFAAARRLNLALKEGRPAKTSRGQRAYFQGEKAVTTWMSDKRARGRRGSESSSLHPMLNYSIELVVGSHGVKRFRTSVLSELRGASQLSGGLLHRRGSGMP